MIEFVQVTKFHNREWPSLDNVSFKIEKGEFVLLTGKSGSGKSTLLYHMYMKELPSNGTVFVDKYESSSIKRSDIPELRRKVCMIFQEPHLLYDKMVQQLQRLPMHF